MLLFIDASAIRCGFDEDGASVRMVLSNERLVRYLISLNVHVLNVEYLIFLQFCVGISY